MSVITGIFSKSGQSSSMGNLVEFGAGAAAGVALNDAWENAKAPGFGFTLIQVPAPGDRKIGIGLDDLIQAGIGFGVAAIPGARNIGLGIVVGTVLSKAGEFFGMPIHILPTAAPALAGVEIATADANLNKLGNTLGYSGIGAADGFNVIPSASPTLAGTGLSIQ